MVVHSHDSASAFAVALSGSVLALTATASTAQSSVGDFTVTETGRSYNSLQSAINAIGNRRGTIAVAPGTYRQCAVQESGVITYVTEKPGSAVFERRACEGKAALVLRGAGAEVRGLVFRGIYVPDGNGAGIRLEKGSLNIANSWFLDSQQGILTANDPGARIYIIRSTFSGLGTCENSAGCAHSI